MTGEYIREATDAAWREKYGPRGTASGPARNAGVHRCKLHGGKHFYSQCEKCDHEFCSDYWQRCPRCETRHTGNAHSALKGGGA